MERYISSNHRGSSCYCASHTDDTDDDDTDTDVDDGLVVAS